MQFSVCEVCKKPLSSGELCPSCLLMKQEIQRYADQHLEAGPVELSEEFDISPKLLKSWVKRGMLNCLVECRQRGHLIRSGTLCTKCKSDIAVGVKLGEPETKYVGKMHGRNRRG